jgi:hypothetical protein
MQVALPVDMTGFGEVELPVTIDGGGASMRVAELRVTLDVGSKKH